MNLLNDFMPDNIISAIGWTIINSLWQGFLIAIMLAALLVILRKTDSRIRSLISIGSLVIFLGLTAKTFINYYNQSQPHTNEIITLNKESDSLNGVILNESTLQESDEWAIAKYFDEALNVIKDYFKQNFPLIVTLWLMGILLLTLRLIGGFAYTQRLKHYKIFNPSAEWQNTLNYLCNRISISKPVRLFESALVKVPSAIGYLKPVILFPLGSLSGLPASQVEAILVHELAHIYRSDYLLNILQSIIETIFFYNPAIWWMSSTIRKEREHCCDDIAVEICGDSFTYAKALVNIQAFGSDKPEFAMGAAGKKEKLFRRINRMILKQNKSQIGGKFAAAMILIVCLFAATIISCSSVNDDVIVLKNSKYSKISDIDDICDYREGKKKISLTEDKYGVNVKWRVYLEDGKIVKLYKNGERIPDEELDQYRDMMNKKLSDLSEDMTQLRDELENIDISISGLDEEMETLKDELDNIHLDIDDHVIISKKFKDDLKKIKEEYKDKSHKEIKIKIDGDKLKAELKDLKSELKESLKDLSINFRSRHDEHDYDFDYEYDYDFESDFDFDFDFDKDLNFEIKVDTDKLNREMERLNRELADLRDIEIDVQLPDLDNIKIDMGGLKKELAKLKDFLKELKQEMVKDNLIEDEEEDFDLEYRQGSLYFNGDKLSDTLTEKYRGLYREHFGKDLDEDSHFHLN